MKRYADYAWRILACTLGGLSAMVVVAKAATLLNGDVSKLMLVWSFVLGYIIVAVFVGSKG